MSLPVQTNLDKTPPSKHLVSYTMLIFTLHPTYILCWIITILFQSGRGKWTSTEIPSGSWLAVLPISLSFFCNVQECSEIWRYTHWWTVFAQTHYWISAIFTWHFGPLLPVWHLRARTTCLWRADYIMVRPHAHLVYSWGATNIEGSN